MFKVDFSEIGEELSVAKEIETKYSTENDAKFRAIEQEVATYDEFRDIVLTSHLKPLHYRNEDGRMLKYKWNTCANISNESAYCPSFTLYPDIKTGIIDQRVSADFVGLWNKIRNDISSRYHFIINYDPALFRKRILLEFNSDILGDLIVTLDNEYRHEDASRIFKLLSIISSLNNFNLLKQMLTIQEKSSMKSLCSKLESASCAEELDVLGKMFI